MRGLGLDVLAKRVSQQTNGKVAKGPFAGMKLNYDLLPVHGAPKFLGTYEQELHQVVERAIELAPPSILNVGCAEGYYAVGFAIRLPHARVWVADADPKAERATLTNGAINGVADRMSAVGIIHSGEFARFLEPCSLLVMDCEGAEFTLLDSVKDPILLSADMLVEVHPEFGEADDIAGRFAKTHEITWFEPRERTPADVPLAPKAEFLEAANERTGAKCWLFMAARPSLADQEPAR